MRARSFAAVVAFASVGASIGPSIGLAAGDAHAAGEDVSFSAALLAGYGLKPFDVSGNGINGYGFGFGARGGASIGRLYLGATLIHHLGGSGDTNTKTDTITNTLGFLDYGVEAGYDFPAGRFVVRPWFALGQQYAHGTLKGRGVGGTPVAESLSQTRFYLGPGVLAMLPLGRWFVGVDLRYQYVFRKSEDQNALNTAMVFATGGVRF